MARNETPYKVECKSSYPFFEVIAAFNDFSIAFAYAKDCAKTNPMFKYRVTVRKVVHASNEHGAWAD